MTSLRAAAVSCLISLSACKNERVVPPTPGMSTYESGQLVIFPGQGIVRIGERTERDGKTYVALKHATMGIYVPAEGLAQAVRRPMPEAEAKKLLAVLRSRDGEADSRHFAYRYRDAMRALVKGTAEQQAGVLHGFYLSKFKGSFGERKLISTLESVLLGELVLATSTPATLEDAEKKVDALSQQLHAELPLFSETAPERPKDPPLERPQVEDPFSLPETDYLGTFTVSSGKIAAGDPVTVGAAVAGPADRAGYVLLDAVDGKWHAYVHVTDDGAAMLFAFADPSVTGGASPVPSRNQIGRLWVDSGQMTILDGAKRSDEETRDATSFPLFSETLVLDRGCLSPSGGGDGNYPVFATLHEGKAIWLGVDFFAEADGEPTSTRAFLDATAKKISGNR